jgi:hypothetical protein
MLSYCIRGHVYEFDPIRTRRCTPSQFAAMVERQRRELQRKVFCPE